MYYFAYASNLNKHLMHERCAESQPRFSAILPNYKLAFVGWSRQWRGAKATIRSFRGEKVRGAVYEISDQCWRRLDGYEGYPSDYDHLNVTVFSEDNEPVQAVTYIATTQPEGKPSADYLAVIQQGYKDWGIV